MATNYTQFRKGVFPNQIYNRWKIYYNTLLKKFHKDNFLPPSLEEIFEVNRSMEKDSS